MKEDKYDFIMKWNGATGGTTGGSGGSGQEAGKVIYAEEHGGAEIYRVCVIPDWQVEQIADAVVKKLSCDECEVAKYHNLEDDDSPCQNCEEPDAD